MTPLQVKGIVLALALLAAASLTTPYAWLAPFIPLALAGGFVIWRWPILSIYLIVGFAPFAALNELSNSSLLSLPKLLGLAGVGVAAAHVFFGVRPISNLKTDIWAMIALLFCAYIIAMAANGLITDSTAIKSLRQLGVAIILFGLVLQFQDQLRILTVARLIAVIVSVPAIASILIDTGNIENSRSSGFLNDPNFFAMLIAMALPITLTLCAIEKERTIKLGFGVAAIAQFVALVQTESRSGLVVAVFSAVLAAPVLWRAWGRLQPINRLRILAPVLVVFVTAAATAPPEYYERLDRLSEFVAADKSSGDRSLGRRGSYLSVGIEMMREKPILGHGPSSFRTEYSKSGFAVYFASSTEQHAFRRRAHNTYLELGAETGVIGLLAFCGIVFMTIRNFRAVTARAARRGHVDTFLLANGILISFCTGAVGLIFVSDQAHKFIWFLAAVSVVWMRRVTAEARDAVQ